jgi:unsaturated rhamnogalacturonyl hydrolase
MKRRFRLLTVCLMVIMALITMIPRVGAVDTDWSVKLCDSVMARYTPATYGGWSYPQGLFLEGMWRVYQRTGNVNYYNFIKDWVDRFVSSSGLSTSISLDSLDNMMPGVLLCHLYQTTGNNNYKVAAQQIRNRLSTYPRTSDGGLVHNITVGDELWLDGAFMLTIFLTNYGAAFNDATYCNDECSNQLIIYNNHLKYPATKLGWHAWDENGSASWANSATHLSPEIWCRAVGWYVVACNEVLEKLPVGHANRQAVINILVERLQGIKTYQDSTTGLWYEVVDKGSLLDNWVEQSSGCMYTYTLSKAIDAGYVSSTDFYTTAKKGYEGILSNIELDATGKTNLYGSCQGTNVGSPYSYYIARTQVTNDNHGQGAFLFANEQQISKYTNLRQTYQAEKGTIYHGITETTNRGYTGTSYANVNNEVGSYVEMTVNVASAGSRNLIFRYANGTTADRPMKIYVNGNVVSSSLSFVATGAWTAWRAQSISVSLNAGDNTVKFESLTATGGPNVDWIAIESVSIATPTPTPTPGATSTPTPSPAIYQAEDAYIFDGTIDTEHAGYTGTGYVNYINEIGSYGEWTVNAATAGTKTLRFRFANGTAVDRPMEIKVNGTVFNSQLSFPGTGAWTNWNTQTINANLNSGSNTIRATSVTADGGPNMDRLEVQ